MSAPTAAPKPTARRWRTWYLVHKWTSLACTLFLFVICLTGLPLVFSDEIEDALSTEPPPAAVSAGAPRVSLDVLAADARRRHPGEIVTSIYVDEHAPQVWVWMAPSWKAFTAEDDVAHFVKFDAHTGALRADPATTKPSRPVMDLVFDLHANLFAGLGGALFLGAMGLLFVAALVSGVVLYGPFMRRLRFGSVRADRAPRLRWLDLHNLLGIVALAWMLVVGVTGVINELSTPLFGLWMRTDVVQLLRPWKNLPPPAADELASPQAVFEAGVRGLPGMKVTGLVYPGSPQGSAHHFVLWSHGASALTSRLFSPALVDARTGRLAQVVRMPWYLRALEVSRPLHFGDYGGTPMKILWTLLDVFTLVVLGSGLYLWVARRKAGPSRLRAIARAHAVPAGATA